MPAVSLCHVGRIREGRPSQPSRPRLRPPHCCLECPTAAPAYAVPGVRRALPAPVRPPVGSTATTIPLCAPWPCVTLIQSVDHHIQGGTLRPTPPYMEPIFRITTASDQAHPRILPCPVKQHEKLVKKSTRTGKNDKLCLQCYGHSSATEPAPQRSRPDRRPRRRRQPVAQHKSCARCGKPCARRRSVPVS